MGQTIIKPIKIGEKQMKVKLDIVLQIMLIGLVGQFKTYQVQDKLVMLLEEPGGIFS
jgi:hypothetical protein